MKIVLDFIWFKLWNVDIETPTPWDWTMYSKIWKIKGTCVGEAMSYKSSKAWPLKWQGTMAKSCVGKIVLPKIWEATPQLDSNIISDMITNSWWLYICNVPLKSSQYLWWLYMFMQLLGPKLTTPNLLIPSPTCSFRLGIGLRRAFG